MLLQIFPGCRPLCTHQPHITTEYAYNAYLKAGGFRLRHPSDFFIKFRGYPAFLYFLLTMADPLKISKFIEKLRKITADLEELRILQVHQQVNQFYYMQKASELSMLCDQLKEVIQKQHEINALIDVIYPEVFLKWQKDARWLNFNYDIETSRPVNVMDHGGKHTSH